ncbi:hypothetical protein [Arthrobacter sp. 92]|uniref:hypothetical protein n=1 Tax=Arthrobacter sp. 92 TaxID=3418175 RepID=UPI003D042300
MTENQWPKDGSRGAFPATYQTTDPYASAAPETDIVPETDFPDAKYADAEYADTEYAPADVPVTQYPITETAPPAYQPAQPASGCSAPSKTDTATSEAKDVAHQAAGSAQQVAQTAKAEAGNVAAEAKSNAKDLLYQAKSDLTEQAGTQQQKVAQGLHSISGELRTMANASDQPGVATDLVRQAADRSASIASWLEGRDPGSLLDEAKSFARQRPGTFLLVAAGAGILAGRLARSLSAGAPESSTGTSARTTGTTPRTAAPQATQLPAQETVIAAGAGDTFFDEPVVAGGSYPSSAQTLPGGTAGETSLREYNEDQYNREALRENLRDDALEGNSPFPGSEERGQ